MSQGAKVFLLLFHTFGIDPLVLLVELQGFSVFLVGIQVQCQLLNCEGQGLKLGQGSNWQEILIDDTHQWQVQARV